MAALKCVDAQHCQRKLLKQTPPHYRPRLHAPATNRSRRPLYCDRSRNCNSSALPLLLHCFTRHWTWRPPVDVAESHTTQGSLTKQRATESGSTHRWPVTQSQPLREPRPLSSSSHLHPRRNASRTSRSILPHRLVHQDIVRPSLTDNKTSGQHRCSRCWTVGHLLILLPGTVPTFGSFQKGDLSLFSQENTLCPGHSTRIAL